MQTIITYRSFTFAEKSLLAIKLARTYVGHWAARLKLAWATIKEMTPKELCWWFIKYFAPKPETEPVVLISGGVRKKFAIDRLHVPFYACMGQRRPSKPQKAGWKPGFARENNYHKNRYI